MVNRITPDKVTSGNFNSVRYSENLKRVTYDVSKSCLTDDFGNRNLSLDRNICAVCPRQVRTAVWPSGGCRGINIEGVKEAVLSEHSVVWAAAVPPPGLHRPDPKTLLLIRAPPSPPALPPPPGGPNSEWALGPV